MDLDALMIEAFHAGEGAPGARDEIDVRLHLGGSVHPPPSEAAAVMDSAADGGKRERGE